MNALYRLNRTTGEDCYLHWAAELAVAAHSAFTYEVAPGRPKRMFWKMSIDLSRPLVSSMGHHDPLDGLVTYLELQAADPSEAKKLAQAIQDYDEMCAPSDWATDDPLGIGGLLDAAARLVSLVFAQGLDRRQLLCRLLAQIASSFQALSQSSPFSQPAEHRLAFRELGLSIGVRQLESAAKLVAPDRELELLFGRVLARRSLAEQIEVFWLNPAHRRASTWVDHSDINTVMLATSLASDSNRAE
jgi:hypothetical protein